MVLPFVIPIAAWGLLRLIAWLIGGIFITANVRDSVTKVEEERIEATRNDTVEAILGRSDLNATQKEDMIRKYLDLQKPGFFDDITIEKAVLIAAAILGAAYVFKRGN